MMYLDSCGHWHEGVAGVEPACCYHSAAEMGRCSEKAQETGCHHCPPSRDNSRPENRHAKVAPYHPQVGKAN